jgi:hypothetical protein
MNITEAKRDFEFAGRCHSEQIERADELYALALEKFYFIVAPTDAEARSCDFEDEAEMDDAMHDCDQQQDVAEALGKIVDARVKVATA